MHSRTIVTEDRFGHEGGGQTGGASSVLDDVLELHHVISCGHQGIEAVVDFLLAARTNLVVGAFKGKSDLGQEVSHFITQVGEVISGGDREVSALDGNLPRCVRYSSRPRQNRERRRCVADSLGSERH